MSRLEHDAVSPWVPAVHLWVVWGLAVVQPLFDLLARNTTFLLFHHGGIADVWLLVAGLGVLPLGLFYLWERLARAVSAAGARAAHLVLLAALIGLAAMPIVKRADLLPSSVQLALAGASTLGLTLLYARSRRLRGALTFAAPIVPVLAFGLLTASGVRGLATPRVEEASAATARGEVPVVLVVFDAFPLATLLDRQLGVDRQLFPNFARLAERSHWFRNASTVSSYTIDAIPALLTGNSPLHKASPTLAHYPENLFTLLDGSYRIEAVEPITRLSSKAAREGPEGPQWPDLLADLSIVYRHVVTPERWLARLPPVDKTWGGFAELQPMVPKARTASQSDGHFALADGRGAQFASFVDSIVPEANDRLYFMHLVLPHFPWRYLPSGRVYGVGHSISAFGQSESGVLDTWWVDGESLDGRLYMRHMVQAQFADRMLGQLIERLERLELFERALLVVTADHGDSFWPGATRVELMGLGHPDDVLRVPLFFKLPGQVEPRIDDRNVDLRDLTPAIADVLGVSIPWPVEGHSPFDPSFPERGAKRLTDRAGEAIDFAGDFAPDLESQEFKNRLFPPEEAFRRLQRFGPAPELIGRRLDDLDMVASDFEVEFDQAARLAALDAGDRLWPVRLSGRVRLEGAPSEMVLALALHGRIEATTRVKFRQDASIFSLFVAEEALQGGNNPLAFVLLEPESGRPGLLVSIDDPA